MALKKCKECGNGVSSINQACDICGMKRSNNAIDFAGVAIILILITFAIVKVGSCTTPRSSTSHERFDDWKNQDKVLAYAVSQRHIKNRLKAPSSAEFALLLTEHIQFDKQSQTYTITSYVDSQNSFGAKIRSFFKIVLKRKGNKKWDLISLAIE